jgi:hypothetical protein
MIKPNSPLEIDYECARNGLTPFAKAVIQNDFQIADVLLQVGKAYKQFVNRKEGKSILDICVRLGNKPGENYMRGAQGGGTKQAYVEPKKAPEP